MKEDNETFEFHLEDTFFQDFPSSEWNSGDVRVLVHSHKRIDGISFDFEINGKIEVVCDRCLANFSMEIEANEQLFVKFGEETDELDDNVIVIPREESQLDIGQFLYEYLILALPMQKIHPDNDDGSSSCDREMINKLDMHLLQEEESTDPRWDELKKLMDKN